MRDCRNCAWQREDPVGDFTDHRKSHCGGCTLYRDLFGIFKNAEKKLRWEPIQHVNLGATRRVK